MPLASAGSLRSLDQSSPSAPTCADALESARHLAHQVMDHSHMARCSGPCQACAAAAVGPTDWAAFDGLHQQCAARQVIGERQLNVQLWCVATDCGALEEGFERDEGVRMHRPRRPTGCKPTLELS